MWRLFNIDILKQDRHPSTKHFIDIIYSLGLYHLITKPTRITKYTATLVDNIFTNSIDKRTVNGIIINDITDHFPVFSLCDYGVIKKHTEMLSTSQYGFRTNMSNSHAPIDLVEESSTSLDKKKYTLGVFIDLKKHSIQYIIQY